MIKVIHRFIDPDLGEVFFRRNSRAKRYIIRIKEEETSVTIPFLGNLNEAEKFLNQSREKLIKKKSQTDSQKIRLISKISEEESMALKNKAIAFLPARLEELAQENHFQYNLCKIGKSRSSWGSCSSRQTIILSAYLILLPENLIDYVILHELCHTIEANHSPAFWQLLDKYTNGQAKSLRKELRNYLLK